MDPTSAPTLPTRAPLLERIRIGLDALDHLKDDPGDPYQATLLNISLDSRVYAALARTWRASPEGRRLLAERPSLQGPELDLEALARLPEGTFGHAVARYFAANGITPFVTPFRVDDDLAYISKRYRETHDLAHVVTGYGTDELGEMELQAFVLGNLGIPSAALILAFSTAMRLRRTGLRDLAPYLARLRAAYRRGRRSRELLSVSYERLWDKPVAMVAELLCAPA